MAEIVEMDKMRRVLAARRGFRRWHRLFSETFDETICLKDLTDVTLLTMIQNSEQSRELMYEFIMGVKDLGSEDDFHLMEAPRKMEIMDIALFLLDQFRFECMRRLGWIEAHPTLQVPLIDLVEHFSDRFSALKHSTPPLSPTHPRYAEYQATYDSDRGAFIRRLTPEALEVFEKRK